MRKRPQQGQLDFGKGRRGGWRKGAGRKKVSRLVHHAARDEFSRQDVLHVTLRVRDGLPNLRRKKEAKRNWRALERARELALERGVRARVIQFSIQRDHMHLAMEAESKEALSSGVQSLKQLIGNRLRTLWGREGSVFGGRYHVRIVETPTETRRLLSYVLGNGRHHGVWKDETTDPFSSAYWFEGWAGGTRIARPADSISPIARARTWLTRIGWRRGGRKGGLHTTEVTLPRLRPA